MRIARDEVQPAYNAGPLVRIEGESPRVTPHGETMRRHGRRVVNPVYRLSPHGVLAKKDLCRTPGWTDPHWRVVDVAPGDRHHHLTQLLTDAAVESWTVLVATPETATATTR